MQLMKFKVPYIIFIFDRNFVRCNLSEFPCYRTQIASSSTNGVYIHVDVLCFMPLTTANKNKFNQLC